MTQIVWWTDVNRVWSHPWGPMGAVIILAYQYFIVSSSSISFLKKKTVGYPSQKFRDKFLWALKLRPVSAPWPSKKRRIFDVNLTDMHK